MPGKVVPMSHRLLAVFTVGLESVDVSALCRELQISRQTFYKYRRRFQAEGPRGLVERSRRPHASPGQVAAALEDAIVSARKQLLEQGLDGGAQSILYRLGRQGWSQLPSVATVHRVLVRRGQVPPQPQKRPHAATRRFVWPYPNDAWQIDATRWVLAGGREIWVMDLLDDHSRLVPAALVCSGPTTDAAWEALCQGGERYGLPARVMSDNGICFTGRFFGGHPVAFETNLEAAGINHIRSTPGHPQTCGKLERFHQTLKKWLRAQPLAATAAGLQNQLDTFLEHYNTDRPHRALGGATPLEAWQAQERSQPGRPAATSPHTLLVTVDRLGSIAARGHAIGVGTEYAGQQLLVIANGLEVSVLNRHQVVRRLTIDPTRRYQPSGKPRGPKPKLPTPTP